MAAPLSVCMMRRRRIVLLTILVRMVLVINVCIFFIDTHNPVLDWSTKSKPCPTDAEVSMEYDYRWQLSEVEFPESKKMKGVLQVDVMRCIYPLQFVAR